MRKLKAIVFGIFYGAVFSVVSGMLLIAGALTGTGGSGFWEARWLYISLSLPFILTFALLGSYFSKIHDISKKKIWLISFISVFFISLYSGTAGVLLGEYIVRGGLETLRVDVVLSAGVTYAFVLLPLTVPFFWLLIMGFGQMLAQFNLSTAERFQDVKRAEERGEHWS